MYAPSTHTEIEGIVHYVEQQLDALRASIVGLTEEQARSRPCRSALSIGGLLKHATYCMQGALDRLVGDKERVMDEATYAAYMGSFALADDETGAQALEDFDKVRVEYVAALAAVDPDAPTTEDPMPWFGIFDRRPANGRYLLVHHIEELARHAGHADIIREEIDRVSVAAIALAAEGMVASEFFEPYVPAAGTIGAG